MKAGSVLAVLLVYYVWASNKGFIFSQLNQNEVRIDNGANVQALPYTPPPPLRSYYITAACCNHW